MSTIKLKVNGAVHEVVADPETPLIYVLRNDLGLKGVKLGCGQEQCGACKVLVDGEAAFSCAVPVGGFAGKTITSIEGLGSAEDPDPVQQAFIDERAAQCGYCIPGMVISVKALLNRNPHPDELQIREALADNLCRCGTHHRILRAVRRAARQSR
ncbi:MAG: (2Fe-2S)-binding protein [Gammaproteobacteria bacterium]